MPIFTLFLITQTFFHPENKQVFYPQASRADSLHSYDVLSYDIRLNLPMTSRHLSGVVWILVRSNQDNLNVVNLHLVGFNIDSLKVDGTTATYSHIGETLTVNLPYSYDWGDTFDIMVGYSGTASGTLGYLWYPGTNPSNRTISYTLGCPYDTKRWMPCYDPMWDKADYGVEFYITVPDSFTVCANGEFLDKQVAGGYATYHWKHEYPIAPYLIHFASSIYQTYSDWYCPAPAESIEIKYYFWPQDSNMAHNAFSLCTNMMYFYDSLFGDYPFEKYGMDVVNPFYYGGMENQTMVTILRSWILGSPEYYGMAHEMSHMWWGDMVTCFGWENVWLNEGFGTYCDALYQEHREGHAVFINTMISRRNYYFNAEQASPHPIYNPPPNQLFATGHSYYKGSWVLHMIRYLCGNDTSWLNLMAVYRDSFAYKNASTDDLNRIMNQVLGGDYDWFFQEWVYDMGYPVYNIDWQKIYEAPNWRLVLDVSQTQTIGPAVFHMPLPIGVNFASGDTILTLPITDSMQHFEFLLSQEPDTIIVDPETWILQKNYVTGVFEEMNTKKIATEKIATIGRAIEIKLNAPSLIKIFDITGRKVYESNTKELNYRPSSAGIYQVIIGDKKQRVVIVK